MREGSSTVDLEPNQALALWATMPVVPRFWVVGPSDQVARRGLAYSLRARGKAPAVQTGPISPAKTDKELVC